MHWRMVRILSVTAILGLIGVACASGKTASSGGADQGRPRDTLVIGLSSEPDTYNPILGYASEGGSKIFDGLLARERDLTLAPALAASLPEVADGGRTITFRLREGVKFHDGRPLTAGDVAFTYSAILDPKVNTSLRSNLEAIDSVEAPDDRTVVFRLKYPYPAFVQRTVIGIVPRHAFEGVDINAAPFNTAPIGTGPFKFESLTAGEKLVLTANQDYWGGAPAFRRVVMAFVEDGNVRAARLESGELDAAELPPKAAVRFRDRAGYRVYDVPAADYRGVMFPLEQPVTGDLAVRQAIDLALDRRAIVSGILAGAGDASFGPIFPQTRWFNASVTEGRRPAGDRAGAEKILDEAGWKAGPGGIREKNGRPARFTLMYPASDAVRKDLALAVASGAKEIGIEVEVVGLDWDAIKPRMSQDALIMGWGSPYDPDFVNYELFHSSLAGVDFFNPGHYRNPEVDRILEAGRRTPDGAERKALYDGFQRHVADDVVWTYLVWLRHVYVVRDAYDGIEPSLDPHDHGTLGVYWNLQRWTPRR